MLPQVQLLPHALSELFATVTDNRYLTLSDRYGLMAAILSDNLSDAERRAADRLLRAIVRGKVQIESPTAALHATAVQIERDE